MFIHMLEYIYIYFLLHAQKTNHKVRLGVRGKNIVFCAYMRVYVEYIYVYISIRI